MRTIIVLGLATLIGSSCKTASHEQIPIASSAPKEEVAIVTAGDLDREPTPAPESTGALLATTELVVEQDSTPEPRAIYFEFDSAELTEESRQVLDDLAEWLVTHPRTAIRIEGHTDARGTSEYNLALGERRASTIARYLTHLGVGDAQMSTVSYGEELPATMGEDESAFAKNRRGEVVPESQPVVGALD